MAYFRREASYLTWRDTRRSAGGFAYNFARRIAWNSARRPTR